MNAIARLTPALLIAAVAAAAALVALQAPREPARADADVVVLPKVEVVYRRAAPIEVVQLPTVHVVAKRQAPQGTLVAHKAPGSDAL